jgi:PAS domain S-box-containing protein
MSRILLFLEHTENRRLLSEWLGEMHYQVLLSNSQVQAGHTMPLLDEAFDLCILDGPTLNHLWEWVQARKKAEQPVFLPFLLIALRPDVKMITRHLWQSIDELVIKPIEKVELQARMEILLRSRQLSLQLKLANEDLQSEIAERRRVEAALAKNEAKFRALVQNSSDVIRVLDADGTVTYASPSSQNVLGFSPEELEGKNAFDFVHTDDIYPATTPFQASLANPSETQISQYRFRHKDGSWRYLESKSNFSPTDTSLNGIVVNSRDITERKQAEEDILSALKKERELNELKSRFVSMISHEIRNPLNSILAATQILERYGEQWPNEKKQDFFQRIKTSVKQLTELLDDILVIGKAEEKKLDSKPVTVDLKKFSSDLIEEIKLSTGSEHAIVFVTRGQCTNAYLDEKMLRHILINLLSNALKYSPPGSTVHFELLSQDNEVIFEIKDEGIGIPLEDQQRLFESFHRATNVKNIPGTGLGLAIVKRCIDIYNGKINFKSEVGVGTTFTVTLPLQR